MSLVRMGVPRIIAEYIVGHDEGGHTIIKARCTQQVIRAMQGVAKKLGKSYTHAECMMNQIFFFF